MKNVNQLDHFQTPVYSHNISLIVICDRVEKPANMGMILRLCDAFNISKCYFVGNEIEELPQKARKVSRSAFERVNYTFIKSVDELMSQLRKDNYKIIGLELTDRSKDLREFDFSKVSKIAFVIGSEKHGLSREMLGILDDAVMIPLFGGVSSLNVVNSLSIGLFEVIRQKTKN
ncbi:TrmH family RNA methyltransferase [Marinigracilibium pacificum]|uniref:TrmH family RNA methyltransferase n=1 Tax=Marinigracilibium pacificum TaxID=2729599 RepID=A0A848J364_9BACT|nr:TrmH family RNA methyltransferase [Marinigracilibium pacificum]NMM48970.1 TrmH family RNA methyltransferase [Marinigracilibium pacificum]